MKRFTNFLRVTKDSQRQSGQLTLTIRQVRVYNLSVKKFEDDYLFSFTGSSTELSYNRLKERLFSLQTMSQKMLSIVLKIQKLIEDETI